jgi:hypothetical protein
MLCRIGLHGFSHEVEKGSGNFIFKRVMTSSVAHHREKNGKTKQHFNHRIAPAVKNHGADDKGKGIN